MEVLGSLGIKLKKRWGQNCMINRGIRGKMINLLDPEPQELIWEIGPGLGALTESLLKRTRKLCIFEIDWKIVRYLEKKFANHQDCRVIPGDFLKTWKAEREIVGEPQKVIGNLPYNSASAIIAAFAEEAFSPIKSVFTVQKELAARMVAKPRSKNYSSFSVLSQTAFRVSLKGDIQPGSFYPEPGVVSSIVELVPRWDVTIEMDRRLFFTIIRGFFSSRRKTLKNNLLLVTFSDRSRTDPARNGDLLLRACDEAGLDTSRRAEDFSPEDFLRLPEWINRLTHEKLTDSGRISGSDRISGSGRISKEP